MCRVLRLMNLTDSRLAQGGSEKLDLAILSFFEQFRKIYVGDQVQKTSKVSSKQSLHFFFQPMKFVIPKGTCVLILVGFL